MRVIDADALAKAFRDMAESVAYIQKDRTYWSESLISAAEEVDDAPTVDAVKVVRCADCKYMDDSFHVGGFDGMCKYWNCHSTDYSWFCSNGERRSE